jgi:hypothetical protein
MFEIYIQGFQVYKKALLSRNAFMFFHANNYLSFRHYAFWYLRPFKMVDKDVVRLLNISTHKVEKILEGRLNLIP